MKHQLVVFVINGAKSLTDENKKILSLCEQNAQITVEKYTTLAQGHAIELAKEHAHRADSLVAVGGDGTFNELINGWMMNPHAKAAVAILPNGTGNDFYRSAKLTYTDQSFINILLSEKSHTIDLVKISNEKFSRYYANIADIGFGGKVVDVLERQRKLFNGKISYGLAIIRTFLRFKSPVLNINWDDGHFSGNVFMVCICNGELFGDGLYIHPGAEIHDGKLNITLLKKIGIVDYLRNLRNLKQGNQIDHPEAQYFTTRAIKIELIKGTAAMECDGEAVKNVNVSVEIMPNAIRLIG